MVVVINVIRPDTIKNSRNSRSTKPGDVPVPGALYGEERFQMSGDDAIDWVFFRVARPAAVDSHEGVGEGNWTRKPST